MPVDDLWRPRHGDPEPAATVVARLSERADRGFDGLVTGPYMQMHGGQRVDGDGPVENRSRPLPPPLIAGFQRHLSGSAISE